MTTHPTSPHPPRFVCQTPFLFSDPPWVSWRRRKRDGLFGIFSQVLMSETLVEKKRVGNRQIGILGWLGKRGWTWLKWSHPIPGIQCNYVIYAINGLNVSPKDSARWGGSNGVHPCNFLPGTWRWSWSSSTTRGQEKLLQLDRPWGFPWLSCFRVICASKLRVVLWVVNVIGWKLRSLPSFGTSGGQHWCRRCTWEFLCGEWPKWPSYRKLAEG